MKRFVFQDLPIHSYSTEEIESLTDKELVDLLNTSHDWDLDLLRDLLWRAHRNDPDWVSSAEGMEIVRELQAAAETLGQHLVYNL